MDSSSSEALIACKPDILICVEGRTRSPNEFFTFQDLGIVDEDTPCWEMESRDLEMEFTLLDELGRDLANNPIYHHSFEFVSKELATKFEADFEELLLSSFQSDLIIECPDGSLKAHKLILITRSSFFKKMFTHGTIESNTNIIPCAFKVEVMKGVLEFIYAKKVDENIVLGLLLPITTISLI